MAYYETDSYKALEALRSELVGASRDVFDRCTPGVPLLQTLGEICALLGIPVDLTLTHEQLIAFIWDLVEILHRRATIIVSGGVENVGESVVAVQDSLLSEVLQEYATGIIVNQDAQSEDPVILLTDQTVH